MSASLSHAASPPATEPVIALRGLVKRFGRFLALRGVDQDFFPARLYVILGENGAGKSTLLRILAGLHRPSAGSLRVLGAASVRSVCGRIGYMAHASLLYDEMSGLENLRYFARLYGVDERTRLERAIRSVGLDPGLERAVGLYSQGMRQRMSLARALLHDPQILLLDEPFSNVDEGSARAMCGLLQELRRQGRTSLVVTHQKELLAGAADEFVVMREGQVVERSARLPGGAG